MGRKNVVVTGGFDDLRSQHVRFLEEASKLGAVYVLLWSDETIQALEGKAPKFPLAERTYLLQANRYVDQVSPVTGEIDRDAIRDRMGASGGGRGGMGGGGMGRGPGGGRPEMPEPLKIKVRVRLSAPTSDATSDVEEDDTAAPVSSSQE